MSATNKQASYFDVCLGRVVKSRRVKADETRASLAAKTGIPEANLKRREAGVNAITTSELERIGHVVGVTPAKLVEEALDDYGGLDKLLAEHAPGTSEPAITVTAEDEVEHLGRVKARYDLAADTNPRK